MTTGGAEAPVFRSGYVTIIGEPNVGKSTLLNRILQQKISIVSSKPQTTRHRILGILAEATYQIVFLDTPGIIKPRYLLQEAMMQFAGRAIADADVLLFMIDALDPKTGPELAHAEAFQRLERAPETRCAGDQQSRSGAETAASSGHRILLPGVPVPRDLPDVRPQWRRRA